MGSGLPPIEVSPVGIVKASKKAIHAAESIEQAASASNLTHAWRQGLLSKAASLRVIAADLENDARSWRRGDHLSLCPDPHAHGNSPTQYRNTILLVIAIVLFLGLVSLYRYLASDH